MTNYQIFNKNKMFIVLENEEKLDVPDFVDKARKRYRFDSEKKILEKQCFKCEKWMNVARGVKSEWVDIHNEEEVHRMNSGFNSYCCDCMVRSKPVLSAEVKTASQDKCSVFLTEKQRKYLKIRAAVQDKSMKVLLFEILESEMVDNPIDKFL